MEGNTDSEAGYINKRIKAVFTQVSKCDDQVVSEHSCGWFDLQDTRLQKEVTGNN